MNLHAPFRGPHHHLLYRFAPLTPKVKDMALDVLCRSNARTLVEQGGQGQAQGHSPAAPPPRPARSARRAEAPECNSWPASPDRRRTSRAGPTKKPARLQPPGGQPSPSSPGPPVALAAASHALGARGPRGSSMVETVYHPSPKGAKQGPSRPPASEVLAPPRQTMIWRTTVLSGGKHSAEGGPDSPRVPPRRETRHGCQGLLARVN
jgi:hypothetical protein